MEHKTPVGRMWTGAFCLCLVMGACGDEPGGMPDALPAGVPVALSEAPILVVGERGGDPDHELDRVVTPFLLSSGGIGVPLANQGTIRIFGSDGEFITSHGSRGEGPGEFTGLSSAWLLGDTIEAFDGDLNRITRFAPGKPPQTIRLEGVSSAQSAKSGLADGSWILSGVKEVQPDGRDLIAVHRFSADGSHLGELYEIYGFRRHAVPGFTGPDPISPRQLIRTEGRSVFVAETLTPRITELDQSTGEARSIAWVPRDLVSADEAVQVARDAVSASGASEGEQVWTLASFDGLTGDEEVSVFWDFLVDGVGFLWVRDYDPSVHAVNLGGLHRTGPGGEWSVLDRDGRYLTTITVPEDFEPLKIESDQLIGIRRDEFDIESVRVYRIVRGGGA